MRRQAAAGQAGPWQQAGHIRRDRAGLSPARKSQSRKSVELFIQAACGLEQREVNLSATLFPGTGTWLPFSSARRH